MFVRFYKTLHFCKTSVIDVILQALIHGLNRHYYSISINYRKNELEQKMLWNLHKKSWTEGLSLAEYEQHCKSNEQSVRSMLELAKTYNKVNSETYRTLLVIRC